MSKKESISYRRHSIKTIRYAKGYRAQAWRGALAVGEVFEADTLDAAVLAVKGFLDSRAAVLHSKRENDGFPTVEEIQAALPLIAMNKPQEAMLMAHLAAADHILTAGELAEAAGYDDYAVANRQYGQLAHDLAMELDWTPRSNEDGTTTWTFTLAQDADRAARANRVNIEGSWRWELRPEIVEALS